jgi:Family of unknown function (DUF5403)
VSDSFTFSGSQKSLNKMIARLDVVQLALEVERGKVYVKAQALFAEHHKTGEHEITMSDGKVDKYVNLEGPAALSIEVGHFNGYKGRRKYVEGLHVLTRALE